MYDITLVCMHVETLIDTYNERKNGAQAKTINNKQMYEGHFTFLCSYCRFLQFT